MDTNIPSVTVTMATYSSSLRHDHKTSFSNHRHGPGGMKSWP
jgi:hypothetical protein